MRADAFKPLYETDPQIILASNRGNTVEVTYRTEDGEVWSSSGEVVMHEGRLQLKSRNQYNGSEFVYTRLDDVEIQSFSRTTPAANWSYNRGRPSDLEEAFEPGMQVDVTYQRPNSRFGSTVEEANISGEYIGTVYENNTYSAAIRLSSGRTEYVPLTTGAQTSISAKAATTPITSFVRRNPISDIVSSTGRPRPKRVQAVQGDDQLTIYNRNKDLYDERSALGPQQRGDLAEGLLDRPINAQQRACINSAHNDVPGNFATYTNAQNTAKGLILARCGFSMSDIRILMREGVTGRAESEGIFSSIMNNIRGAFDGGTAVNSTARAIGRRPVYHGTSSRNLKRICDSGVLTAGVPGVGTLHPGAVGVQAGKPLGTTSLDTAVRYSESASRGGYDSFAFGQSADNSAILLRTYPIMGTQDLSTGSSQALKDQTRRFNRPVPTSRLDVSYDGGKTFNRLDCSQVP